MLVGRPLPSHNSSSTSSMWRDSLTCVYRRADGPCGHDGMSEERLGRFHGNGRVIYISMFLHNGKGRKEKCFFYVALSFSLERMMLR